MTKPSEDLEKHGVTIDAEVHDERDDELPPHVENVRLALLDFSNLTVSREDVEEVRQELGQQRGAHRVQDIDHETELCFRRFGATTEQSSSLDDKRRTPSSLDTCREIAQDFAEQHRSNEANIREVYHDKLFLKSYKSAREFGRSQHQPCWSLRSELVWNEDFDCLRGAPKIPSSRPDLTYGLRMYTSQHPHATKQTALPASRTVPPGQADWPTVRNLHSQYLMKLRQDPALLLQTTVTRGLSTSSVTSFPQSEDEHLLCFPFAVVEAKRARVGQAQVMECYSQIARAATRALCQRRAIAAACGRRGLLVEEDIPPFVGFSCVGATTRVWLAYVENVDSLAVKVKCIWSTSMLIPLGVYCLQTIISNMLRWAEADFRMKTVIKLELLRLKPSFPQVTHQNSVQVRPQQVIMSSADYTVMAQSLAKDLVPLIIQAIEPTMPWSYIKTGLHNPFNNEERCELHDIQDCGSCLHRTRPSVWRRSPSMIPQVPHTRVASSVCDEGDIHVQAVSRVGSNLTRYKLSSSQQAVQAHSPPISAVDRASTTLIRPVLPDFQAERWSRLLRKSSCFEPIPTTTFRSMSIRSRSATRGASKLDPRQHRRTVSRSRDRSPVSRSVSSSSYEEYLHDEQRITELHEQRDGATANDMAFAMDMPSRRPTQETDATSESRFDNADDGNYEPSDMDTVSDDSNGSEDARESTECEAIDVYGESVAEDDWAPAHSRLAPESVLFKPGAIKPGYRIPTVGLTSAPPADLYCSKASIAKLKGRG